MIRQNNRLVVSKAAILMRQASHSFDLLNFVSEYLCLRRRTKLCALDSPLSHKVQEVNIIASTVPGIMQKDGDGWSPVASRSTELL